MFEKLKDSFSVMKRNWQLNRKLSQISRHIEGTPAEIKDTKDLLQTLIKYDIGRDLVMNMPNDISICREPTSANARASFSPFSRKISLPKGQTASTDRLNILIDLAHEMRHAVQTNYGYGIGNFPRYSQEVPFIMRKMCELETQVQDIFFESQLLSNNEDKKSSQCQFYDMEKQRFKDMGLSDEQATIKAKTSVAQIYWSGLTDKPENCSLINEELEYNVRMWNNSYDIQALKNTVIISEFVKKMGLDKIDPSILEAEASIQEAKELLSALSEKMKDPLPKQSKTRDTYITSLMQTCVDQMGLDKSASYFMDHVKDRTTVGDMIVLQQNEKGAVKSAVFCLPNGNYALREYNKSSQQDDKMVCIHEVVYNKKGEKDGLEIRYTDAGRIESVTPYKNHVRQGGCLRFDYQNKRIIFARYENDSAMYFLCCNEGQILSVVGPNVSLATQEQEEEYKHALATFPALINEQRHYVSDTLEDLRRPLQEKLEQNKNINVQPNNAVKQQPTSSANNEIDMARVMHVKHSTLND